MKRPFKRGVITCVPLQNAVLCADCECISESNNDVCGVCGGRALVNLGRLLGSAAQGEAAAASQVGDPLIRRPTDTLGDSPSRGIHAVPQRSL
jgi:hypothetical protein